MSIVSTIQYAFWRKEICCAPFSLRRFLWRWNWKHICGSLSYILLEAIAFKSMIWWKTVAGVVPVVGITAQLSSILSSKIIIVIIWNPWDFKKSWKIVHFGKISKFIYVISFLLLKKSTSFLFLEFEKQRERQRQRDRERQRECEQGSEERERENPKQVLHC